MVLDHYKLVEQPFGVTPDPRFLYFSATHREAMASVMYGLGAGRGFSALIAPPGMGKTTILFDFLNKLRGLAKTVFLFQSQDTPESLMRNMLTDLGVEEDGTDSVAMQRKLNEQLESEFRQGRKLVVVLDEAQNLDNSVLEMVRMLSNFETSREKLMYLILSGQPSLAEKLVSPSLTQLRQRISIVARLEPFNDSEIRLYINHRLRVAGFDFKTPMFSDKALMMISQYSSGIPRNINNICFNAMLIGAADRRRTIGEATIREVVRDLDLERLFEKPAIAPVAEVRQFAPSFNVRAISPELGDDGEWLPTWARRCLFVGALATLMVLAFARVGSHAGSVPAASGDRAIEKTQMPVQGDLRTETNQSPAVPKVADSVLDVTANKIVVVKRKQTLCEISTELFGKCDESMLARFRESNPAITNPDHIEVGQAIRIPGSLESLPIHPAGPVPNVAVSEMEKQ